MKAVLESLPVLILCPHSRCNCRCMMCNIWKDVSGNELSTEQLERYIDEVASLAVEWVVLSGGEPLMHSGLSRFCYLLRDRGIRTTILSTGLLLERNAEWLVETVDDVIVSLDGPPAIHDRIRRVQGAFWLLERGVHAVQRLAPEFKISARCTVQRENHAALAATARTAKGLGLHSISFLAVDVGSSAFNRPIPWGPDRQNELVLDSEQIQRLEAELDSLQSEGPFVVESRDKLQRIVSHFRAHLGLCEPVAPRCNAPWVSAVVEADGTVRPCFFHRPIGSVREQNLLKVINGPEAIQFREKLDVETDAICRRCVCSLNWNSSRPLAHARGSEREGHYSRAPGAASLQGDRSGQDASC
ncbi:MAG TPA: radical SAM protein [Bryobacteraceae bacterium]|nr:radical SAM protein [Bryobacteraceae bacterium]